MLSDAARPSTIAWVSDRLGRPVERGELDDGVFDAAVRAAARPPADVARAHAAVDAAVEPMLWWWNDYDVLVTPATFQPPWLLGGAPGPAELGTLAAPFSLTGQPALSLPLHRTDDGLPIGVQLVRPRHGDELLLALAADLQAADDWTVHRPPAASSRG